MVVKVTRDPVGFYANVLRLALQLTSIMLQDTHFQNTNYSLSTFPNVATSVSFTPIVIRL